MAEAVLPSVASRLAGGVLINNSIDCKVYSSSPQLKGALATLGGSSSAPFLQSTGSPIEQKGLSNLSTL